MIRQLRIPLIAVLALLLTGIAPHTQAGFYVLPGGGKYKAVLVVAKSGSPFTSVQAALDSISGADQDNRYLIRVGPGAFTGRFAMLPWVDIVGSGPNATVLQAAGGASFALSTATATGADNALLSELTVRNTGGAAVGIALFNSSTAPTLWRVNLEAEGATDANYGAYFNGGEPSVKECTIIATSSVTGTSTAVVCANSSPTFQNCDIGAYDGEDARAAVCSGGLVTFQDCRLGAEGASFSNWGMNNSGIGADVKLYHTQVSANGSGTSANQIGIYNTHGTHVKMYGCQVESLGGASTYGVANLCPSSDVQIDGFYAYRCSIRAHEASGNDIGVYSTGKVEPRVEVHLNHCDIEGATNTVANGAFVDTHVAACRLDGGDTDIGTDFTSLTCAGCYDENQTFYAGTCP